MPLKRCVRTEGTCRLNNKGTTKTNIIVTIYLETLKILEIKESTQELYIYVPFIL